LRLHLGVWLIKGNEGRLFALRFMRD
jgi:hypothetical protein